ncbi:MAG TPA: DUF3244 domain-containing protein [Paludibacter sp.]|nr:DUF3244 domain-containing protein [Paludibacter sp.]
MKKINLLKKDTVLLIFLSMFSVYASSEIIIRFDDWKGTVPKPTVMTQSATSSIDIPLSANLIGTDLILDFTTSVGTAYISVVDNKGDVVYQTVADTVLEPEVIIPLDGLKGGKYSVKISYGSTNLIGDFQL